MHIRFIVLMQYVLKDRRTNITYINMYCIYKPFTHTQSLFGYVSPGDCVFLVVSLFLLTNHCPHRRIRVHWYREIYIYKYVYIYSMSVRPSTGSCQQSGLCLSLNDPQLGDHRSMVNDRWFGSVRLSRIKLSWIEWVVINRAFNFDFCWYSALSVLLSKLKRVLFFHPQVFNSTFCTLFYDFLVLREIMPDPYKAHARWCFCFNYSHMHVYRIYRISYI